MTSHSIRPEKIEELIAGLREWSLASHTSKSDARIIAKAATALASLKAENDGLRAAIAWALGEKGDFPIRQERQGAYYWRTELRRRAFLAAQEAKP